MRHDQNFWARGSRPDFRRKIVLDLAVQLAEFGSVKNSGNGRFSGFGHFALRYLKIVNRPAVGRQIFLQTAPVERQQRNNQHRNNNIIDDAFVINVGIFVYAHSRRPRKDETFAESLRRRNLKFC